MEVAHRCSDNRGATVHGKALISELFRGHLKVSSHMTLLCCIVATRMYIDCVAILFGCKKETIAT